MSNPTREEFRASLSAYLAATCAAVEASPTGRRLNVRVTVDAGERFYEMRAGRHWCALPVCICEVEGAGVAHFGGRYHAAQLVDHLNQAFPVRTAKRPVIGTRRCAPRAAEAEPTAEQVAAIMARHGLTPDGEPLPKMKRKRS